MGVLAKRMAFTSVTRPTPKAFKFDKWHLLAVGGGPAISGIAWKEKSVTPSRCIVEKGSCELCDCHWHVGKALTSRSWLILKTVMPGPLPPEETQPWLQCMLDKIGDGASPSD